jgi:hypothetical protein
MSGRCNFKTLCLGERNQRRLTVSGLAHLKAVERLVPQLNKLRGLERIDHLSACVEVKA